ncbi:MAG: helix-turn-helix domain-containing protein [Hyphomicrobiales bacterium]
MDKRETVEIFKQRLTELIDRTRLSRAQFAAKAGLDRSTLSQLLAEDAVRLPRADTIARIAARHKVSADWLLGLSQRDQVAADVVAQLEIEAGVDKPVDERLIQWHEEASGFKIRYVPATIPDLLKTDAVIDYEYSGRNGITTRGQQAATKLRLRYSRRAETDMEACASVQSLRSFAYGEGMWAGLDESVRREQLEHMQLLTDELYPTFRWFLFDGLTNFAVPYTVFGPQRAAIYLGGMYFVFTSTEHIRELSWHFDTLIRQATVQPNETAEFISRLLEEIP